MPPSQDSSSFCQSVIIFLSYPWMYSTFYGSKSFELLDTTYMFNVFSSWWSLEVVRDLIILTPQRSTKTMSGRLWLGNCLWVWVACGQSPSITGCCYLVRLWIIIFFGFLIRRFLGGWDGFNVYNNILEYNPETEEWQEIGAMKEARYSHAVTLVSYEDYAEWCN